MYARNSTYVQGRPDRRARNPDNKSGVTQSRVYVMDRRESSTIRDTRPADDREYARKKSSPHNRGKERKMTRSRVKRR